MDIIFKSYSLVLTEFDVAWLIGIHAVGIATGDVSSHCHGGIWVKIIKIIK